VFDYRARERLKAMGEWMKYNNQSIYSCTEAPAQFKKPDNCLLTYNPETNRLYVHLLDYPLKRFTLKGYGGKVKYAQFLHDDSELKFGKPRHNVTYQEAKPAEDVILILPVIKPPVEIPVIELVLN
jgi:alpha-L-fucosidase